MASRENTASHSLLPRIALLVLCCLVFGAQSGLARSAPSQRFYFNPSPALQEVELKPFNVCVVNPEAAFDIDAAHGRQAVMLARLDLTQANAGAMKYMLDQAPGERLSPLHTGWAGFASKCLVEPAASRGFSGFALCGLEGLTKAERSAVSLWITALADRFPEKQVWLENASDLLPEVSRSLDGYLQVGLSADGQAEEGLWQELKRLGLPAYAVALAEPENLAQTTELVARLESQGCVPFITTPAKDGTNLGPWREVSRKMTILYGGNAEQADQTAAFRWVHAPLEWLGYLVEYVRVTEDLTASEVAARTEASNGVILDPALQLTSKQQEEWIGLLKRWIHHKTPVLLTGMPWTEPESFAACSHLLGFQGSGMIIDTPARVTSHLATGTVTSSQTRIQSPATGLRRLQAASGSEVLLSLRGEDSKGQPFVFDQAFLDSWGGVWIEPLLNEVGAQLEPLNVLEKWLKGTPQRPAMDLATRHGRRLLVSAIQSEGFSTISRLRGLPSCAEVMREQVLERYALPFTVSLSEAEVRCWLNGQEPKQAMRQEQIARTLLALPNVEAAIGTFSRPEGWAEDQLAHTEVSPSAPEAKRGLARELSGPFSYFQRRLLPAGKSAGLLLWPMQGASPTLAALNYCQSKGIPHFGFRNKAASAFQKGLTTYSTPLCSLEAGVLSLTADSTPAATNGPVRAPYYLSLSFEEVRDQAGLKEVEQRMDQVVSAPLHALSATRYAYLANDACHTRILQKSPQHWIIVNAGMAQTIRFPTTAGVPDLAACRGVAGWKVEQGQIYIHTTGKDCTELVMTTADPKPQLHLVESSGQIEFAELGSQRALFEVADLRPVELAFGGLPRGGICAVTANGEQEFYTVDGQGSVRFTVPSRAAVQIQMLPDQYVSAR